MSKWPEHSDDLHELVYQSSPEARRELEQRLAAMPTAERAYWLGLIAEVDGWRKTLGSNGWHAGMEAKLLDIPKHAPPISPMHRLLHQPVGWMHYAAAVVVLTILGGAIFWSMQPGSPPVPPQLNQQVADAISQMAITHHSGNVQINNSIPSAVESALMNRGLPFSPVVLHPTGSLTLKGGGSFDYRSSPVAFTRWSGDGANYTLYQFDAKQLGAPTNFAEKIDNAGAGEQVVLWPAGDGASAWALVLENSHARDMFSGGCR